jgi:thiol:disulfide interchange protein
VRLEIAQTVSVVLFGAIFLDCTTPAQEHPVGSARSTAAAVPSSSAPAAALTSSAPLATATSAATARATSGSKTGSAYFGCGQPIPLGSLWDETSESEVLEAISAAKACAGEHGRRLLLEFVAPWCEDCQEMAKLDQTPVVAETLESRFERVRINVGKWDRHEGLRKTFDVRALATYVVIDPKTSKELAKTTLEPITKKGQKLSADDWARWLGAH